MYGCQQQRAAVGAYAHLAEIITRIGERLPHARFGEEQGQRLASFRDRERSSRFLT